MKDIKGYEGKYAITEDGRVWNYRTRGWQALHTTKNGYVEALLSSGGTRKHYQVHRLVLMTYKPIEGMESLDVDHIDENRSNNCLSNLQWLTHKDNCKKRDRKV